MKVLVDMNLSPRWVTALQGAGIEACHWSAVGAPNAPDADVLRWTAENGFVLLTNDLDFGAILASSGANIPSVIQFRTEDLRPEVLAGRVASTIAQLTQALADGALVTIEPARERVRILPLRPERSR
jgi:predicted nuclease of predicted toxin-antitoxin system